MYQVMIVDDEPMAASLIVNIIKQKYNKFEIMGTAYDGEEALELMEKKRTRCSDHRYPDAGDEWTEACRRNKETLSGSAQCDSQRISGI